MSVSRSVTRIGRRRPFATTAKKDAAVPSELLKAGIVGPPGIVEVAVTIHERPNSVRSMLNKRCYFATRVKKIFRTRPAQRSQPVTCAEAYNVAVSRRKLIRGMRLQVAIPARERLRVNFGGGCGCGVWYELAFQIKVRNLIRQTEGIACSEIAKADHRESLLGKAHQRGAIAEVRAVVGDDREAAVFADEQAQRVLDLLAVVEDALRLHFREQG